MSDDTKERSTLSGNYAPKYDTKYNKGKPLDEGTLKYFKNVGSQLSNAESMPEEDRDLMIKNIFSEVREHEYRLSVNPNCSKVLEKLFKMFTSAQVKTFFVSLKGLYLPLFTDRVASHVMQAMLFRIPEIMLEEFESGEMIELVEVEKDLEDESDESSSDDSDSDNESDSSSESDSESSDNDDGSKKNKKKTVEKNLLMQDWLLKMCVELTPHWLTMITSTHGSFIMRTLLLILAGHTGLTKEFVAGAGQADPQQSKGKATAPESNAKSNKTGSHTPAESRRMRILGQSRAHMKHLRGVLSGIVSAFEDVESGVLRSMTIESPSSSAVVVALLNALSERQRKPEHRAVLIRFLSLLLMWKAEEEEEEKEATTDKTSDDEDADKEETPKSTALPKTWKLKSGAVKHVNALFSSAIGSRLIEGIISAAPPYFLAEVFNKHMLTRVFEQAKDRFANHCVQKLLETLTVCPPGLLVLSRTVQALATPSNLAALVTAGRSAILWKLTAAVVRFSTNSPNWASDDSGNPDALIEDRSEFENWETQITELQIQLVRSLAEATGSITIELTPGSDIDDMGKIRRKDREACAQFLPRLLNLDFSANGSDDAEGGNDGSEEKKEGGRASRKSFSNPKTNQLMGSLLVQELLKLGPLPNLTLAASALALDQKTLIKMLSDATAVRMVEAMLASPNSSALREKDRKKIIMKLEGAFAQAVLAGPSCAFLMEKLYKVGDTEVRTAILKDLSSQYRKIATHRGGFQLLQNIKVQEYMQTFQVYNPDPQSTSSSSSSESKNASTKNEKVNEMFADLLGTKRKHSNK